MKNLDTLIIGAGVSGLTCGINLLDNNYKDFLIFEALDRIGGRCHTVNYADSFLEYGAQVNIYKQKI
jgi:monoamine oxidase